jgi:hypothetical protein
VSRDNIKARGAYGLLACYQVTAAGSGHVHSLAPCCEYTESRCCWHFPAPPACNAWHVHIGELIDQHRIAQGLDEATLSDIVRRFIAARNACTPGRYELGLRIYEEIPIGPVQREWPR